MAFTSVGCLTATIALATQSWPAGSKTVGPVALPDKFTHGLVLLDLTGITDLLTNINIDLQVSTDGIAPFSSVGGFGLNLPQSGWTLTGGVIFDGSGNPVRTAGTGMKLPPSLLTTRQIQLVMTSNNPAVVGVTVAVY